MKKRIVNSAVPDGTARYEQCHLELHCLLRYLIWSTELKGLNDTEEIATCKNYGIDQ